MKLAREIFDGGNDAGSGAIHGVADNREAAIAHGIEQLPTGQRRKGFKIAHDGIRMRGGEDQVIGLQANDFFEIHLRPVLRSVHNTCGFGSTEGIGNKSVFPHRDKRARPDDKQNATGREQFEPGVKRGEASLKISSQGLASFGHAKKVGEFLGGGKNVVNVAGMSGVSGDAEGVESADGLQAIDFLGNENEVRMERRNLLEIWIDDAADFLFLLRVGRKVAVVGVPDEAILDAEGVERFRQAGCEGNDARGEQGDANSAAGFVNDFVRGGRSRRSH